jgi:hypothetical protein
MSQTRLQYTYVFNTAHLVGRISWLHWSETMYGMNNLKIRDNFCLYGRKDTLFLWLYHRDVTANSYVTSRFMCLRYHRYWLRSIKFKLFIFLMFMCPCIVRMFNYCPTRCNYTQFICVYKLLYMFRVVPPPITRSTYNCIYSIWY